MCDRQFSCDLDPESLRKSKTFFFKQADVLMKSLLFVYVGEGQMFTWDLFENPL